MGWWRRAKSYVGVFLFGVKIAGDWTKAIEDLAEVSQRRREGMVDSDVSREMTLGELVETLHRGHAARREFDQMVAREWRTRQEIAAYLRRRCRVPGIVTIIEKIESGEPLE